ncbi:MAG: hypothetical protein AB7N76_25500 [Planctomycetota bacterium]
MSGGADRQLRKLERARSLGDAEAAAALLAERVRRGQVAPERLRLAAYVGHPVARALAPEVEVQDDLAAWLTGLCGDWGLAARNRTWFSLVWSAAPSWWLSKRAQSSKQRVDDLARVALEPERALPARALARLTGTPTYDMPGLEALRLVAVLLDDPARPPRDVVSVQRSAARAVGEGLVNRRLEADLAAWALGEGDPVAERRDPEQELCERTLSAWEGRVSPELLALRLRFGDLQLGLLEAAGRLGSNIARDALDLLDLLPDDESDLGQALLELANPGRSSGEGGSTRKRPVVAVGAAIAERGREAWEARNPGRGLYRAVQAALDAWLREPSLERERALKRVAEEAYEQPEVPWALYRAAQTARARDAAQAASGVQAALRWLVASERVQAAGDFDYRLARALDTGGPAALEQAQREALGLGGVSDLLETPEALELREGLGDGLLPHVLTPTTKKLQALFEELERRRDAPPVTAPAPPEGRQGRARAPRRPSESAAAARLVTRSRASDAYLALDAEAQRAELLRRVKAKELSRKQLRLAAALDHEPARAALGSLRAACPARDELNAVCWGEELWTQGGSEAWARALLASLEEVSSRVVAPMRDALTRWLLDPRHMALEDVQGLARAEERKVYRGEDRDPSQADELREEWSTALLTVGSRRTKGVDVVAGRLRRERVSEALLPWALGLLGGPSLAVPAGVKLRPYRATESFAVGEWISHQTFGRGRVLAAAGRQVEVAFEDGEVRKLAQGR